VGELVDVVEDEVSEEQAGEIVTVDIETVTVGEQVVVSVAVAVDDVDIVGQVVPIVTVDMETDVGQVVIPVEVVNAGQVVPAVTVDIETDEMMEQELAAVHVPDTVATTVCVAVDTQVAVTVGGAGHVVGVKLGQEVPDL
jgi:hypothetical protein